MNRELVPALLEWFRRNARDLPWRRTRDPYAIWVSEVMLQQTQVKTVLPYWDRWMRAMPDVEALAGADSQRIHKLWEGLGYYTRVRNLQSAARAIVASHGGSFPEKFEDLLALPGIGRYTAGAICSIAFNQPKPILDGNIIRVLTRLFAIGGDPRATKVNAELWRISGQLITMAANLESAISRSPRPRASQTGQRPRTGRNGATRFCSELNQSLMELGALVCTPTQPKCGVCPVSRRCVAFREGRVHELPNTGARSGATSRRFFAFVVQKQGRFLVCQRPAGVVNAHLWEFPNMEIASGVADPKKAAQRFLRTPPASLELIGTIRHTITRYRITLDVFRVIEKRAGGTMGCDGRWFTRRQLGQFPFTSAHRRIVDQMLRS